MLRAKHLLTSGHRALGCFAPSAKALCQDFSWLAHAPFQPSSDIGCGTTPTLHQACQRTSFGFLEGQPPAGGERIGLPKSASQHDSSRGMRNRAVPGSGQMRELEARRQQSLAEEPSTSTSAVVKADEGPPSELQVASLVDHPALIVTRNIEWGTVILGYEVANRYTIYDEKGEVVGLLAEDLGGLGKTVGRQLLRTRRSFTATVFSPDGTQVLFRVRRPAYLVSSTMFVEDGAGNVVGEVHQRWHLWRRKYDMYLDRKQFAAIDGGLLAWDFALRDRHGGTLALIDRNFQGFGKEFFTDAGKYVIHFGQEPADAAEQVANTVAAAHPDKPRPQVTALARTRSDVAVIPTSTGNQLEVVRPLALSERMLTLAAAVAVDYDYFSRLSHHGPGMLPFFMPLPVPGYPPPDPPAEAGAPDAGAAAGAAEEAGTDPGGDGQMGGGGEAPLERDLGGDTFDKGEAGGGWGWGGDDDGGNGDGGGDGDGEGGGMWGNIARNIWDNLGD